MGIKYSRQREAIKNHLASRTDHPTAKMIYRGVRVTNAKISLGTVYRNLELMTSTGEIIKLCCGDGVERYDANTNAHCHFYCGSCGSVKDIFPDSDELAAFINGICGENSVKGCSIVLYGTCPDCMGSMQ